MRFDEHDPRLHYERRAGAIQFDGTRVLSSSDTRTLCGLQHGSIVVRPHLDFVSCLECYELATPPPKSPRRTR